MFDFLFLSLFVCLNLFLVVCVCLLRLDFFFVFVACLCFWRSVSGFRRPGGDVGLTRVLEAEREGFPIKACMNS